jgi:hypothetical protein
MKVSNIILILILLAAVFILYYKIGDHDMIYVHSDIDNNMYMVRNRPDKVKAANLLARTRANIFKITDYLYKKINDPETKNMAPYIEFKPYIIQLQSNIQNVMIRESDFNSVHTSYTKNKGTQIVFCIRSKEIINSINNDSDNIHDINLVMYVALHEISHVACPEIDHTPLFNKIFSFICQEGVNIGIYQKIDFANTPKIYCGMTINASII